MRYLITGASGFIGRNLMQEIERHDQHVVIPVTRSQGFDLSQRGWTNQLEDKGIDIIIHLAQSSNYKDFPDSALDMLHVNVDSTAELLEWSRLNGVKKFIFTSTGTVYSNESELINECSEVCASTYYAATKLSAEYIVNQYVSYFDVLNLRLFGVYGPNQVNTIIPIIISRIINGKTIELASGEGIWITPIYVDDCVKMIYSLSLNDGCKHNGVLNLSGKEKISLAKIVELLEEIIGKKAIIERSDQAPSYLMGDSSNLYSMLGIEDMVSIRQGLRKAIGGMNVSYDK